MHADIDGLTLNDVVLAVTSGALRRWLAAPRRASDRLADRRRPGRAGRERPEPRLVGNNVSNMFTTLATDVDDPVERLRTISTTARHAKAMNQQPRLLPRGVVAVHAAGAGSAHSCAPTRGAAVRGSTRRRSRAIVSNVPGPRERLKIAGAQLGRRLQRRAADRGHRAQRHRVVVRRPDELLAARLPRPAAGRRGAGVVLPGGAGRTARRTGAGNEPIATSGRRAGRQRRTTPETRRLHDLQDHRPPLRPRRSRGRAGGQSGARPRAARLARRRDARRTRAAAGTGDRPARTRDHARPRPGRVRRRTRRSCC